MNLEQVVEYIWNNSHEINFGESEAWNDDTFLSPWFNDNYPDEWVTGKDRPGWYWFSLDNSLLSELELIQRPEQLPLNACDFGAVFKENKMLFGRELVHNKLETKVIYNGHESNVISRIRSHFSVSNDRTGALGIKHYNSLSAKQWTVHIFLKQYLDLDDDLSNEDKLQIKRLCDSKTGRVAIEQAWRSRFGWPALSKA
ncbi:hypothetical protein J4H63_14830 [Vibrio alginolyticus]|uniref:hypothetical protein n=1 Tax=Vibrio alginolyticus TaxID=663 RepID=UPI001BD2C98E|nr:hypothetical protein [Vibrio alginolyticus]MBS9970697.1 hypothetical protein [Vibrio alginolyticus]